MVHVCRCSIFQTKKISLPILVVHAIISEIEAKIFHYGGLEAVREKFSGPLVNKFIFHVKIKIDPPGQLQKKLYIFAQCTVSSLLDILSDYLDLHYLFTIEMCDNEAYDEVVTEFFEDNIKILEIEPLEGLN